MTLAVLIPAVLSYVRTQNGFATKTKLLKLLYLLDIEAFRTQRATLTGFEWIFYKYGPWAPEYDRALESLEASSLITLRSGERADLDTIFIDAVEGVQLSRAFPAVIDEMRARRIIEAWADRPTGEVLDYVYFHTAPMREARRGEKLDFSKVLTEEQAPAYRRTASSLSDHEKKVKRKHFRELMKGGQNAPAQSYFLEPRYDADFWKAVDILDRDSD
jgi:Protein of unknown function (DUF4065)